MYLLDTNVVSELRKPKPHGAVLAWFAGVEDMQLHLSAVTIGEIQVGIELTREQDELAAKLTSEPPSEPAPPSLACPRMEMAPAPERKRNTRKWQHRSCCPMTITSDA